MSLSQTRPPCELCGAPALVSITNNGGAVRRVCLECADAPEPLRTADRPLNYSAVLLSLGAIVVLLAIFADRLGFGDEPGFGWMQDIGLIASAVIVLLALLLRVPTLAVIGLLAAGLSLLADLLGFGQEPGFGWHQAIALTLGILLIAGGARQARRRKG